MSTPADHDVLLESLLDELRVQMEALNELYQPVHPADPRRVTEIERRRAELRSAVAARRRELSPQPNAASAPVGTGARTP